MNKAPYLIPLLLALIVSSCSKSPSMAIEDVLNECASITSEVNNSNMSPAQAAQYIARESQDIDVRDCPPEFRVAFQQHVTAWREAAPYLDSNVPLDSFIEGFYGGMTGDYSYVGNSARNTQIALQRINATYNRLTEIAAQHGARIPRSVVE